MENYEVISQIGKGSFGIVSKIRRKTDSKILVWKELNYGKMGEREKHQLVSEVNILKQLQHPNIVQYYDRIIDKKQTKIYIIMEYCEGGDMGSLLKRCKKEQDFIAEDVIWKIFTQIVLALNECHTRKTNKILHRDLKPANIFLDAQNNIKLGDFGLARVLNENSTFAQTHVGTPYYMSPEQITEARYNEKSDIWSLGCLVYELAALKPPFEASNHLALAMKIRSGKFDRIPLRYSEDLQKVIRNMLEIDAQKRVSIVDLINLGNVVIRIKEKKIRDRYLELKKEEEQIKKKEDEIKLLLEKVEIKEKQLLSFKKRTINNNDRVLMEIDNQNY